MNQTELERIAGRLGSEAAAGIDLDRAAAGVVARLRARREPAWWARPAVLRVAAAVTIVMGAGLFAYRGGRRPARGTVVVPVALRALSTTELQEVLDSLGSEAPVFERVATGMGDLSEDQLRELLHRMEG